MLTQIYIQGLSKGFLFSQFFLKKKKNFAVFQFLISTLLIFLYPPWRWKDANRNICKGGLMTRIQCVQQAYKEFEVLQRNFLKVRNYKINVPIIIIYNLKN